MCDKKERLNKVPEIFGESGVFIPKQKSQESQSESTFVLKPWPLKFSISLKSHIQQQTSSFLASSGKMGQIVVIVGTETFKQTSL